MGIKLIVEVMDHWKDAGLTAGEKADLLVLAENANDGTRMTYGGVHEPYILNRAGKSPESWRNAIGKLTRKGALVQHLAGHSGQVAVYRIGALCPDPPHEGWRGLCTRPERVTSQVTQPRDEPEPKGHLSGDPNPEKGHLSGVERVTSQVTPTPLTPLTTSSLSLPEELVRAARVVAEDEEREFIRWIKNTHKPKGPAWWRKVASHAGDFADLAVGWRSSVPAAAQPSLPRWCGQCGNGSDAARFNQNFRRIDGEPCPTCNPAAADAA